VDRLLDIWHSKVLRFALAGVVLVAGAVVVVDFLKGPSTYRINAVYTSAPGLFPGAAVDVLGVPVGTVTSVKNVGDRVEVGMAVHSTTRIPSSVVAALVAPQVLGQPDVALNPGYTGGPYLAPGATIPESRTSVPISTDQFLKELQRTLNQLNPHAVSDVITNLAQDLDGQGAGLNHLIASAAGTLQLLANKGNDLGKLNGSLAQLTGTLDSETAQIEQLVQQYDTVSTVIAQHSGQLNDALTQLTGASTALVQVLTPNLLPLEADVGTVTTVSRTLDRNIASVDELLQQTDNLFQGAKRAIDPHYNWLDLNAASPPGVTGAVLAGLVRDSLAGVCRRIVANHLPPGLTAGQIGALNACGDPNNPFFNPIINQIPTLLNTLTGAQKSSPSSLLQQGLNQIGSLSTPAAPKGNASNGKSSSSTTVAPTTVPPTTTTTKPNPLCTLVGAVLKCPGGSSTTSGGSGGLLSQHVTPGQGQQTSVNLAVQTTSVPSLTAPSARFLPPMPTRHTSHPAHRFWLAQWTSDVTSWL
jgi:virulence factor Mce-like protein